MTIAVDMGRKAIKTNKQTNNSTTVKLLTEKHLEFQSLKGGCTGSSDYIHVEMPHCGKSHVVAQILFPSINVPDACTCTWLDSANR